MVAVAWVTPYAPKTMEEFNQLYNKQTGGSKQAYDYLTGKADYSATPFTKTGELMKPYFESVMGVPPNIATKKVLFDPATKKYKTNPDYVPISYSSKGEKVYGLSDREIIKRSTAGEDFAKDSGVTYEQISKALNISINEAKKRYPALAASTTNQPRWLRRHLITQEVKVVWGLLRFIPRTLIPQTPEQIKRQAV
jgi:hypothetical protein